MGPEFDYLKSVTDRLYEQPFDLDVSPHRLQTSLSTMIRAMENLRKEIVLLKEEKKKHEEEVCLLKEEDRKQRKEIRMHKEQLLLLKKEDDRQKMMIHLVQGVLTQRQVTPLSSPIGTPSRKRPRRSSVGDGTSEQ